MPLPRMEADDVDIKAIRDDGVAWIAPAAASAYMRTAAKLAEEINKRDVLPREQTIW